MGGVVTVRRANYRLFGHRHPKGIPPEGAEFY